MKLPESEASKEASHPLYLLSPSSGLGDLDFCIYFGESFDVIDDLNS